jgi:hypothetical protein
VILFPAAGYCVINQPSYLHSLSQQVLNKEQSTKELPGAVVLLLRPAQRHQPLTFNLESNTKVERRSAVAYDCHQPRE